MNSRDVDRLILTTLQNHSFREFETYSDVLSAFTDAFILSDKKQALHKLEKFDNTPFSIFHAIEFVRQFYTSEIDLSVDDVRLGRIPEQMAQAATMYALLPTDPIIIYGQLCAALCQLEFGRILDEALIDPDTQMDQKEYVKLIAIIRNEIKNGEVIEIVQESDY